MNRDARRRLLLMCAAYCAIVVLVGGGVTAASWSSVGGRYALIMGAVVAAEGVAVLAVGAWAARRAATRGSRAARTWEDNWGPEVPPRYDRAPSRLGMRDF